MKTSTEASRLWRQRHPEQERQRQRRRYLQNKEASRMRRRRVRYGLNNDQFWDFMIQQAGCCGICDRLMKTPYVDHDHQTGRVRGLLCCSCNNMLGIVEGGRAPLKRFLDWTQK